MFDKRIATETTTVLDKAGTLARNLFISLGKSEASEEEVREAAENLGINFEEVRTALTSGPQGMRRIG